MTSLLPFGEAMESMETKNCYENGNTRVKESCMSKWKRTIKDHKILVVLIAGLIILAIVIGIILAFTLPSSIEHETHETKNRTSKISDEFRLPRSVLPNHYVLEVQPYLIPDDFRFEGNVKISMTCVEETDRVILHSNGLSMNISDIRIQRIQDDSNLKIRNVTFNESNDFVIIELIENLKINNVYLLIIKYNGMIYNDLNGFYISEYRPTDHQDMVHYTASTQFEPAYARNAFPCFDEPAFKATFDIIIVRWRNMTSLSNMPKIKVERRDEDWEADIYATSMKMSTYLVAFVIGKYVGKIEGKVTIWAPKGINGSVDFALDHSLKFLTFYEDILGVPYDAPKLDMAAVMRHIAEAMENWGLIIYDKSNLLFQTNSEYTEIKQTISHTISHEMAHQWFGNLVTPKWWSDIWLNEGFATYMQQIAFRHFFPNWTEIDATLVPAADIIFMADCMARPSTVWKNVTDKESVISLETFNIMPYFKGAMIVRMIHHILGNKTFWEFLTTYLNENAYGNVDEMDFWSYVNEAQSNTSNVRTNLNELSSWTHLPGIPIVSVERNYRENTATFSQISCRISDKIHESDLWPIPISYRSKNNTDQNPPVTAWLSGRNTTLFNMPAQDDWILITDQSAGCYVVNYDKQNWKLLADQLKRNHMVFLPDQRYKILADASNLYKLKHPGVTVDILLNILVYLHNETVWSVLQSPNHNFIIESLSLMKMNPLSKEWKEFIIHILGPLYDKYVWSDSTERNPTPINNDELVFWFCDIQYISCIQEAMRRFDIWKHQRENEKEMAKYGTQEVLCTAARENNSNSNFLYQLFMENKSANLLNALMCSSNSSIIEKLLQEFQQSRTQLLFLSAGMLLSNEKHWAMLLDYIDDHFEQYTNNRRTFHQMKSLFNQVGLAPVQLQKILEITKKHLPNLTGVMEQSLKSWIEEMEQNLLEMKSTLDPIENWLKGRPWKL